MAAPSYTSDLTATPILIDFPNTTNWTALGGGGAGLTAPETDYFVQGSNCISKAAWASATKGMIYNYGSGITVPSGSVVVMWLSHSMMNSVAARASGGIQLLIGSGSGAFNQWYVGGSDTEVFGLHNCYPVDPTVTPDTSTGGPGTTKQYFGGQANLPSGGPTKGYPWAIDAMRYGRMRIDAIYGSLADGYCTLAGCEAVANAISARWGILQLVKGTYLFQGFLSMGTSGNACDWRDSNRVINILDTVKVTSGFNRFEVMNASSNVEWTNYIIKALGTTSPGTFVVTAGTFTAVECQFINMGTFTFLSTSSATTCTFRGCGQITAPGTTMTDSRVLTPTVVADASALVWNIATDPDGYLDGMTFSKGTNAHHAIQLGTSCPTSVTLRDWTTSGFNASDGQNDSTIYLSDRGSDTTWTINVVGGNGNFSYKKARAGDTVNIVIDPVTHTFKAQNADGGAVIQGVRVLVWAAPGGSGSMKADAAITSITRSSSTATVTTTADHNLATGEVVLIENANFTAAEEPYCGPHTITVTDTDEFTFTVSGTPTTPATDTYRFSEVIINNALTNSNGEVSDSRTYSADQLVKGIAAKGSTAPTYKTANISTTLPSDVDSTTTIPMTSDD